MSYLYSMWGSALKEVKGSIVPVKKESDTYTHFLVEPKSSNKAWYVVSPKEGTVYNRLVWFYEPDVTKAVNILIDHFNSMTFKHEDQINRLKTIIQSVKADRLEEKIFELTEQVTDE